MLMIHLENLGRKFPGSLVGESVFRTAKLEMLIESSHCMNWPGGCSRW